MNTELSVSSYSDQYVSTYTRRPIVDYQPLKEGEEYVRKMYTTQATCLPLISSEVMA